MQIVARYWWALALCATNGLSFAMMAIDKRRARRRAFRISERALMIACASFGALGGMVAMLTLRHKTQHVKFAVGLPVMLAAQILLAVWLASM